jgi:hypothetical protein
MKDTVKRMKRKDTVKRMKRQAKHWEKAFAKHCLINDLNLKHAKSS